MSWIPEMGIPSDTADPNASSLFLAKSGGDLPEDDSEAPVSELPTRVDTSPCERARALVEAAGYPPGIDYEAMILEEADEYEHGWY